MSVLACDRNGCDNIMCDCYSSRYGYICFECLDELIATGPKTDINVFMQTEKKPDEKAEARARYNAVFQD